MPSYMKGASGSMSLKHEWDETAGHGNPETTHTLRLEAAEDGRVVQLVERRETAVLAEKQLDEVVYEIPVVKLVELIRKFGTQSR